MPDIAGIIPAAGAGTRFGSGHKLLAPLTVNKVIGPVILHVVNAMQSCTPLVVVIRKGDKELESVLSALPVVIAHNTEASKGMSTSIVCGIRMAASANGWCIMPGDMPYIRPETCRAVFDALRQGFDIVVPGDGKHPGHPVGFGRRLRDELLSLQGDTGARGLLQQYRDQVHCLGLDDPGIRRDVDRVSDLQGLRLE